MQAIIVRAVTLNDLPQLTRLWHEKMILLQQFDSRFILTPETVVRWPLEVRGWLEDDDCHICVAERDHNAVGYAIGWVKSAPPGLFSDRIGYVTEIVVDAHAHQGGLGRLLLSTLREWFTAQEIKHIVAYVPHRGAVEQAFWRAQGAAEWVDLLWIK